MIREKTFSLFIFLLMIALVFNPLSHYMENVLEYGNTYYVSYVIWMLFALVALIMLKYSINKRHIIFDYILFSILIMASLNGENHNFQTESDIHLAFFLCIAFWVSMCQRYKVDISKKQLHLLYATIIVIGVLSSIYALLEQTGMYILSLQGVDMHYNSWGVVSFYRQRNIFAQYCVFCSIAACYMYIDTKKKAYLFPLILFAVNILVTNSRASLIFFLVSVCPIWLVHKTYKKYSKAILIVLILLALFLFWDFAYISNLFDHSTSAGEDSGGIRINMWKSLVLYLLDNNSLLIGFGKGSVSSFLSSKYGVGSSHNYFVDSLFEGGLIYLTLVIYSLYFGYRKIRTNPESNYRFLHICAIVGYTVYCMLEAGSGLFAANYFSITATILFIIIPQYYNSRLPIVSQ